MCDECEKLSHALKVVQNAARTQIDSHIVRVNASYRRGYKDAGRNWEDVISYAKEQEKLRFDENVMFTEEIMRLEEEVERLTKLLKERT